MSIPTLKLTRVNVAGKADRCALQKKIQPYFILRRYIPPKRDRMGTWIGLCMYDIAWKKKCRLLFMEVGVCKGDGEEDVSVPKAKS